MTEYGATIRTVHRLFPPISLTAFAHDSSQYQALCSVSSAHTLGAGWQ